ncbi:aminotransferase class I/II-fold pyridoxal phosphate-dependent enzyme [Flagellimonas algicola]|uniref:Pyridoxal phosphate-dependent aminotransferase family protein n=1 Tax=Flagellimonas algicola TaxID=2583815 RepID=A0ABY2WPV9_9FLAO|nr:aminotransferase class I/II-fold pyridoxal phosphate-dependent enzyme [Allomuricauda algicola]TMU57019.1 pyridoxal phosphate-dependent aminotransferase family protein [Allomuricauda algicola]
MIIDSYPGRTIYKNWKEYLYFGGTSYLGLQLDKEFQDLYIKNLRKYGTNYGASRKSNIQLKIFEEAETHLAKLAGSESCITLSSGYLAAQLVVQALVKQGHPAIAVPNAHIALSTDNVIQTASPKEFHTKLSEILNLDKNIVPVILFDTIDFSKGQYPDFELLRQLPLDKIILVGDDSHGIGIVGTQGNGCYSMLKQLEPVQLIVCSSLGKGLGIQAGAVFGDKAAVAMLRDTSFFGGASPASPAFLSTLLNAGDIYNKRRGILMKHLEFMEGIPHFKQLFTHITGHPTFEFCNPELAKFLEQNGFIFTNFNYPDDNGPIVSRIVLSAYHKKEDIHKLADCLHNFIP